MAEFNMVDELIFNKAIDFWIKEVSLFFHDEILKITPRDLERLPINNIDRKDGKKPVRSSHFKPVFVNWHWYEWVSWMLKKSIISEKIEDLYFMIWVSKWYATKYARHLEYGTVHMAPRSFIRKWIYENLKKASTVFENTVSLYFKNF